jgi:2-keto-4-pentenoate hydratase/2-oxohepta-3-ene-1,7-dioic acid hydratase in catechol pathway
MRFAHALFDTGPSIIARMDDGEPWRHLDLANDMFDVLHAERLEVEAAYRRGQAVEGEDLRFLAPLTRPGKIIAIGRNYMDHVREQNAPMPDKPIIFAKYSSSITGPNTVIQWDPALTTRVDYEAELAVIIGHEARNVGEEKALLHVFGYTCANDVTARDLQHGDGQWTRSKSLDTFGPLGPVIVTTDEMADPQKLKIRCELNGKTMQDSSTAEMIFDVKFLVSYASRAFTLYPGDIILTGTPAGVGDFRDPRISLHDGDSVVVEIERIGRLENICREVAAPAG